MIDTMDEGFEKIDLNEKIDISSDKNAKDTNTMKKRRVFKNTKRMGIGMIVVILVVVLFSFFGIFLPAQKTISSARKAYEQTKVVIASIKKQDINAASDNIKFAEKDLNDTVKNFNAFSYLRFVPIVGFYYNDAAHLLAAGAYAMQGGDLLIASVKPYADVLGLKGNHSFVMGSAQDRITLAVKTMDKITPRIDDIQKYLLLAKQEVDSVDPNHYPPFLGMGKIRDQLTQVKTFTDQGAILITNAKPLVKILPSLMGEPNQKKYLVIFQNDKELRPTGGFMTAYAIFRLEHGIVNVDKSDDIYTLDNTISRHPGAPRPILQYLPQVSTFNLRDTNLSPDFKASMEDFNKLYQQAGGYQKVDGIIAIDTHALVAAMNILGDMQVDGSTFTTKIDTRCNCSQVIYELEVYADQPVNYIKGNRKGIVGDLLYAIMQKAFSSSPKLYWGPLFQSMIAETNQKHILFDMYNDDAQKGLEALNAAGRIQNVDGDYLHINEANLGGAKSNLYVKEAVTQKYDVQGDGTILKTVTIDYKNPYQPSDCNLERGNLCLNAILRNWFRLYVPKGSVLVDSQGSEVKMTSYDELGKTVFEGFNTIRPLGSAKVTVSYRLPFKLTNNSPLPLLIQKQPGTDNNDYTIMIKESKVNEFPLLTDKMLKLNVH